MNSQRPKPAAEINLEEFERRLRASAGPQAGVEDPLAELTRLVDAIGFERSPTERLLEQSRPSKALPRTEAPAKAPPPPPAPVQRAASMPPAPPAVIPPTQVPAADALRPTLDADDFDAISIEPMAVEAAQDAEREVVEPSLAPPAGPPRARHWKLKVGGLIAAAAVMAGAVVVFKVGGHSSTGAPPLILASSAPTKVAPPSDATIRTANETGALLAHDTAQPTPTPPKLVNTPEAPVDLSARPAPSSPAPAAVAAPAPAALSSPAASLPAQNGSDTSPVALSSDTPIVPTPAASAPPASPAGADPSRVKTISVRPDGTLIASGYDAAPTPAPAQTPTPTDRAATAEADAQASNAQASNAQAAKAQAAKAQASNAQASNAQASNATTGLPTKLSPPKSPTRVVAPSDTTAPADAAAPPPAKPKKPKPSPAPAPLAEAEPTDGAKPDEAAAPEAPSGGYAVQLAAPRSESDAKGLIRSLSSRYADALGGQTLGVRKAERDGRPIYRVRAAGLSKAEAAALCSKIKAAGGDCYVAKN